MADLFNLVATLGLDTSAFESALGGVPGIISGVSGVAGDLLKKAGAMTLDFAKDVLKTGLATDKALGRVNAVTNATEAYEQELIKTAVLQEAAQSTYDAAEVAMAAYYEGLAGYSVDEVVAGLHGIVVAAEASGESLQRVSDILTDTVTAFGDNASDQSRYADVFAATATNANTTVAQMGQALKYVGPLAGALGYDIEEVALTLGIMADNAVKGSQAGTTLRNIFTRISTNAGATTKDLGALQIVVDKLGVDFYDSEGKVRPWLEVLDEMRTAWQGVDEATQNELATAFGTEAAADASENVKALTNDLVDMKEAADKAISSDNVEYLKTVSAQLMDMYNNNGYADLFKQLGVKTEVKDIYSLSDALDQARIRYGQMTDQEQIYFAKQIGSMRGMSGFLALMTTSADKYDDLKEAIYGASGAADSMRDITLDNLSGDVEKLYAQFDVLKYSIFDDVKGPMRDVVQYATDALERITKAINEEGLVAGIDQFALEIKNAGNYLAPIMTSLGEAITPMIQSVVNNLLPDITSAGAALAGGFVSGIGNALSGRGTILDQLLGGGVGLVGDALQLGGGLMNLFTPSNKPYKIEGQIVLTPESVQAAIDEATAAGATELVINDVSAPIDAWYETIENLGGTLETGLSRSAAYGLEDGAKKGVTAMRSTVIRKGDVMKKDLSTKLGNAGSSAGSTIVNAIQTALKTARFVADIVASVSTFFGGGSEKHAKSMYGGTILRGATMFGYNANGEALIGGDAGPEAIIGTNSLQTLITGAVNKGLSANTGNYVLNIYQQPGENIDALTDRIEKVIVRRERSRRAATK